MVSQGRLWGPEQPEAWTILAALPEQASWEPQTPAGGSEKWISGQMCASWASAPRFPVAPPLRLPLAASVAGDAEVP